MTGLSVFHELLKDVQSAFTRTFEAMTSAVSDNLIRIAPYDFQFS
jgi:hypothetical protein